MGFVVSLVVVFIISFLLVFILVYRGEKDKVRTKKGRIFPVLAIAMILALVPTVVIMLGIILLLGSTNVINIIFSLHLSTNEIAIFAILLMIYLFTIDSIIEMILKQIVGKNMSYFFILLLIRILAMYAIGLAINFTQSNSFIISLGVALIIYIIEVLDNYKGKGEKQS